MGVPQHARAGGGSALSCICISSRGGCNTYWLQTQQEGSNTACRHFDWADSIPVRIIVLAGNILLLKLGVVLLDICSSRSWLADQRAPLLNTLCTPLGQLCVQPTYGLM